MCASVCTFVQTDYYGYQSKLLELTTTLHIHYATTETQRTRTSLPKTAHARVRLRCSALLHTRSVPKSAVLACCCCCPYCCHRCCCCYNCCAAPAAVSTTVQLLRLLLLQHRFSNHISSFASSDSLNRRQLFLSVPHPISSVGARRHLLQIRVRIAVLLRK
jgi:hypothetical protein